MPIVRHPDVSTIMTCSAGSQPEALCAVVTSHLSMCPECMRELSLLEEIGVSLFECSAGEPDLTAAGVPSASTVFEQGRDARAASTKVDVPWPLIAVLGDDLDAIEWTEIRPGIAIHPIELSEHAKGDLRLLRLDPGKRLPSHGHQGEELSLVLRGSYSDETGSFGVGDMSDLDDDTRHSVLAGPEGCIVLIASEKTPEFLSELAQATA
jgi:putative transcriptional regulator